MITAARIVSKMRNIENPVLVQEMRIRQRGAKPFWVMFIYVLLLCAAALIDMNFSSYVRNNTMQSQDMSKLGQEMFQIIVMIQLALILLIVPAYSSSSVASERERGTFDLLVLTLLSSGGIVRQKLFAAMGQVFMLVIASMPVVAIVFLLGGVSPLEIAEAYGIIIATAILLSAIGMLCSCCIRNSRTSTFLAYLIPILAYAGFPMCFTWLESMGSQGMSEAMINHPFLFTIMFTITGAIPAFAVYGLCAAIMGAKTVLWRTRAFRMAIFGGVYAILLLIMSIPSMIDALLNFGNNDVLFVPNPYYVLAMSFNNSSGYGGPSFNNWMLVINMGISLGIAYIFERISTLRFNALRRSN